MQRQYNDVFPNPGKLIATFPDKINPSIEIGTIAFMAVSGLIILLVVFGTVVDRTSLFENSAYHRPIQIHDNEVTLYESRNDHLRKTKIGNFFSSFSVPRNFGRIFYEPFAMQKELRVFNGVYIFSFVLVILNNTYFISTMYGLVEQRQFNMTIQNISHFMLARLHLVYELYFFSIGFIS